MSAFEFLATLRRRWYVLVLVGLCTIVAALLVHKRPIVYGACEGLYVSGPRLGGSVYLNANPSLAMVTGMVTQTIMSQPMQQKIRSAGVVADYEVTQTNTGEVRFPAYTQPTLQICASSASPQAVLAATQLIAADYGAELHRMQVAQNVKHHSLIKVIRLFPATPVPLLGQPSLASVGVLLMGAIGGVALTLWSDRWLTPQSRRRLARESKD